MRALKRAELGVCIAADAETRPVNPCGMGAEAMAAGYGFPWPARRISSRTRFCKWLVAEAGGDVSVRTVAVIRTKRGEWHAKEVVRARAGGRTVSVRDLGFHNMSGYVVDWSAEGAGRVCYWNDGRRGRFCAERYDEKSTMWRLQCEVLNPEVLQGCEKFRYCAWSPECGDVLEYLKLYLAHPRAELLPKAGVPWLARSRGFVARLESNRELMRFVSRNLAEIRRLESTAAEIGDAFKRGCALEESQKRCQARRNLGQDILGLIGRAHDAAKVMRYVDGVKGLTPWEYRRYLMLVTAEGHDLADTAWAFPRDFHRAMSAALRRGDAREWRRNAKKRREIERGLREMAARFAGVAGLEAEGLLAAVPVKELDFKHEGEALEHCVYESGYHGDMAKGKCLIVMVRRAEEPEKPFVTAELDPVSGAVRQCYGKKNARAPQEVLDFVEGKVSRAVKAAARKWKREKGKAAAA